MLYPSVAMVENLTNCRYDGDVVKEFEKANATHVVCKSKDEHQAEGSAKIVSPAWIWKCIKHSRIVPIKKFLL